MPLPTTWRNITINDGSKSAALGNTAAKYGQNTIEGLAVLEEQLKGNVEREDKRLTNEATYDALTGGPKVSSNRRVDAKALYDVTSNEEALQDDLKTSAQARNVTAQDLISKTYENSPGQRKLATQETVANIGESEAATRHSNISAKREAYADEVFRRTDAEGLRIQGESRELDKRYNQIYDTARSDWLEQNAVDSSAPTQIELESARIEAGIIANGPQGRSALRAWFNKNGMIEDSWDISKHGGYDAVRAEELQARAGRALERQTMRQEAEDRRFQLEEAGDFGSTGTRGGRLTTLTPDEAKDEKMGSTDEAIAFISRGTGVGRPPNVNQLQDTDNKEERKLIDQARQVFVNGSFLASAIEPYIASDGELDIEGFRKVVNTSGYLARMDAINKRRTERGLPAIEEAEVAEGSTGIIDDLSDINGAGLVASFANNATGNLFSDEQVANAGEDLRKSASIARLLPKTPNILLKAFMQSIKGSDLTTPQLANKLLSWPYDPYKEEEEQAPQSGTIIRE